MLDPQVYRGVDATQALQFHRGLLESTRVISIGIRELRVRDGGGSRWAGREIAKEDRNSVETSERDRVTQPVCSFVVG